MGLHSVASAFMWLYTIQKVDSHQQDLPELIKNVNAIDPKFSYPYAFATLILPSLNFTNEAIEIGKEGIKNADPDWRIPFYLATTYHIFLKDRANASLYFDIASNTPGAPEKIHSISARYGTSQTELDQTREIWTSIYETSNDELVTERAKRFIIHLDIVGALKKAILLYKQRYGHYPPTIDDLVTAKILKALPQSPLGVKFGVDKNGKLTIE